MTDHIPGALASALPADDYGRLTFEDARELGQIQAERLAEAGYVLVHTAPDEATVERLAEVMREVSVERELKQRQTCTAGCGCRYMTEDPDARDCACDGPCCMDPDWWDGRSDYEIATCAVLAALADTPAQARHTAGDAAGGGEHG